MNDELLTVNCLRCQRPCRTGTPDPNARMIRRGTSGFCPDCIITKTLLSIAVIREIIEGTPSRGTSRGPKVPARDGLGPECLLLPHLRKNFQAILAHTQMSEDEINWPKVVEQWSMPWPKGKGPAEDANY